MFVSTRRCGVRKSNDAADGPRNPELAQRAQRESQNPSLRALDALARFSPRIHLDFASTMIKARAPLRLE